MSLRHLALWVVVAVLPTCASEPDATAPDSSGMAVQQPAPLFGGTVTVSSDGRVAAVSDPDRNLVRLVEVASMRVITRASFGPGSEPGRGVDDGAGHFAVVLRRSGQVAFVSQRSGAVVATHRVCAEPRGVTKASLSPDGVLVVCATGEVYGVSTGGARLLKKLGLEGRDIIEANGRLTVSTFRDARLYEEHAGLPTLQQPRALPAFSMSGTPVTFAPQVAWRTLMTPSGDVVMVHQVEREGEPTVPPPGATTTASRPQTPPKPAVPSTYGGGSSTSTPPPTTPHGPVPFPTASPTCPLSVLRTAVTRFDPTGPTTIQVPGVLPVDAALSPDGTQLVIAHAGSHQLTWVNLDAFFNSLTDTNCGPVNDPARGFDERLPLESPIGVAFTPGGELLVHYRVPNVLVKQRATGVEVARVVLGEVVQTPGHRLFHFSTGAIACASCHPEGHEDGHTWTVNGAVRRTQSLTGGLLSTAPFHWKGDLAQLSDVMADTFVSRMGGAMPSAAAVEDLGHFLDGIPAPKPFAPIGTSNVTAGRAAFVKAGCESCHGGPKLGSNATLPVGKREATQVPSLLGVARRGPWMSDGCAKTLEERFTNDTCGGTAHGHVDALTGFEVDALVDYLERL
jgi:DNA-binding beta-propeller fold protein YncE